MTGLVELQKALDNFRDWLHQRDFRGVSSEVVDEFEERLAHLIKLFSGFVGDLPEDFEMLKQKAKTLPQIVETCDVIRNSKCKQCFGQCEFEGTEHFKGKWVSVDVVEAFLRGKVVVERKQLEDFAKLLRSQGYTVDVANKLKELLEAEK